MAGGGRLSGVIGAWWRRRAVWWSLVLLLAGTCPAWSGEQAGSSADLEARAAEKIRLAGRNSGELREFLRRAGEAWREDALFLVANMPYRDLGSITAELLLDNLAAAERARELFPWGAEIPRDVWRHWVLPYRFTQEPLRIWRTPFLEALIPVASGAESMGEAALAVNRWVAAHVKFKQTVFRDQGPMQTLAHGIGRCEEMTILFLAAARAVGIPARSASTPWWATCDNNHAWAEVWVDGGWHYIPAAEKADVLDLSWFTKPARRAAAVYSTCYGDYSGDSEPVYRRADTYSIINRIADYAPACPLEVEVLAGDRPAAGVTVTVSVFNYGAFRAVARQTTDERGRAEFLLGRGQLYLTAGDDEQGAAAVVTLTPEGATQRLVLEEVHPQAQVLWLRYPSPEE